jgi:hypothetical protein
MDRLSFTTKNPVYDVSIRVKLEQRREEISSRNEIGKTTLS